MRAAVRVAVLVIGAMGLNGIAGAQVDRIAHAKRAVAARPNDAALWVTLAELLNQAGRVNEAADAYQAAVRLDAKSPFLKLALARVYFRIDRLAGPVRRRARDGGAGHRRRHLRAGCRNPR